MTCPPPPYSITFLSSPKMLFSFLLIIDCGLGACCSEPYNYPWFISYSWGLIWRLLTTPAIPPQLVGAISKWYKNYPAVQWRRIGFWMQNMIHFYCSFVFSFYTELYMRFSYGHKTERIVERGETIFQTKTKQSDRKLREIVDQDTFLKLFFLFV
jgi:hypothetical protein